jgi:hypothetical protein
MNSASIAVYSTIRGYTNSSPSKPCMLANRVCALCELSPVRSHANGRSCFIQHLLARYSHVSLIGVDHCQLFHYNKVTCTV